MHAATAALREKTAPPGMETRHLRVGRTARWYSLGEPGPRTRQVWLACHGYGQLAARFLRRFESLDDGTRYMVAPEALNRFYIRPDPGPHGPGAPVGATWMTREDRLQEIEDYVGYLDALCGEVFRDVERERVEFFAVGFSQGVATICRWAARASVPPDRLILWAGSLPDELQTGPRLFGAARVTLVLGDDDPYGRDGADGRLGVRLEEGGRPFDVVRFHGGHELDASVLRSLASRPDGSP